MLGLTNDELEALRSMPSFREAVATVKQARAEAEAKRLAESGFCEGAESIREKTGYRCPKCGLFLEYTDRPNENKNHEILMRGHHWNRPNRPGANPFTENGHYGKAAGGDWYMDH